LRILLLTLLLLQLAACATVGRVAYSRPVIRSADSVRLVGPRESAAEIDRDGITLHVDLRTLRFAGVTGLIVPFIPFATGDQGSEELLHVALSLRGSHDALVVDPSAITLSVEDAPPMKPVCAVRATGWRRDGSRDYVYLVRSAASVRCDRGLLGRRSAAVETGSATDSLAPNATPTYDLFYPIRRDEPRPLVLRIEGIRSPNGVVVMPVLRYERRKHWRFAFGDPF
jgi:hypothetical protein